MFESASEDRQLDIILKAIQELGSAVGLRVFYEVTRQHEGVSRFDVSRACDRLRLAADEIEHAFGWPAVERQSLSGED